MPISLTTKPAANKGGKPAEAAQTTPAPPEKIDLVLRGCERYDHERQLYQRNIVYTFGRAKAAQMLRLKDENERPYFVRYVPGAQNRRVMVEVPKQVDMTRAKVTPPPVNNNPPEVPARLINVGDDAELGGIEGLHLSADAAGVDDDLDLDVAGEDGVQV